MKNRREITGRCSCVFLPLFPLPLVDVPECFRHAASMASPDDAGKQAAGRALEARMGELRFDAVRLAGVAEVKDPTTIRDLISGKRWPQAPNRARIEEAVGWKSGTLMAIAQGAQPETAQGGDVVEMAIERSDLTRANKAKLLGMYFELLDDQERRRGA